MSDLLTYWGNMFKHTSFQASQPLSLWKHNQLNLVSASLPQNKYWYLWRNIKKKPRTGQHFHPQIQKQTNQSLCHGLCRFGMRILRVTNLNCCKICNSSFSENTTGNLLLLHPAMLKPSRILGLLGIWRNQPSIALEHSSNNSSFTAELGNTSSCNFPLFGEFRCCQKFHEFSPWKGYI